MKFATVKRWTWINALFACVAACSGVAAAKPASPTPTPPAGNYLTTIGSADLKVNTGATYLESFVASTDASITGGAFLMKAGNATSEPLMFRIFSGNVSLSDLGSKTPIATATLSSANFASQVSNSQQFSWHWLTFSPTVSLVNGETYTEVLSSSARSDPSGQYSYFLKDGTDPTAPISLFTNVVPVVTPAVVPEPGSLALLGAGLAVSATSIRWRRRRRREYAGVRGNR